jgi:putative SOS response-associated peptidase YedK
LNSRPRFANIGARRLCFLFFDRNARDSVHPETKQRSLDRLRWGLVPYWAKDEKIGFKTINTRAETVDTAHSFRSAFRKRRCLIPADGFYEWKKVIGGKISYSIEMKDDSRGAGEV